MSQFFDQGLIQPKRRKLGGPIKNFPSGNCPWYAPHMRNINGRIICSASPKYKDATKYQNMQNAAVNQIENGTGWIAFWQLYSDMHPEYDPRKRSKAAAAYQRAKARQGNPKTLDVSRLSNADF